MLMRAAILFGMVMAIVWHHSPSQAKTLDQLISAAVENVEAVQFMSSEHADSVVLELDMKFKKEQYAEIIALNSSSLERRRKRNAMGDNKYRWTGKVVPFEIQPGVFGVEAIQEIQKAMSEWAMYTCVTFRLANQLDINKIKFTDGDGCSSYVGMVGNVQEVTLAKGCRSKGIIAHELGHALGFQHEQTRPDRDDYVTILYENIPDNVEYNFNKYSWGVIDDFDVPYDYKSIMHYGGTAFSVNGQDTIQTRDAAYQSVIGNREHLSFRDIKIANKMLECKPAGCQLTDDQCPGEGFVNKLCQCACPGDPVVICQAGSTGQVTGVTGGGTGETGTEVCQDLNPSCPLFKLQNLCTINPGFMNVFCRVSCNTCGGATAEPCLNANPNCDAWSSIGFCVLPQYRDFMITNCKKACGICHA